MFPSRPWLSFVLVVTLTVLVLGWIGQTTWSEIHQLQTSFAAAGSDSFHLSDYIEGPIGSMNEALLQHTLHRDEASRRKFLREGGELKQRLRAHNYGSPTTLEEGQILPQNTPPP